MWYAIKRLSLGLFLIGATSAVLLIADREHRTAAAQKIPRIALIQHASSPVLDDGVRGFLEKMDERGFHDGRNIVIGRFNAHGDMPTGVAIAHQVTSGDFDLVVTSSTPSMQAVAKTNQEGKVRHVFFLVADPFASGVGLDRAHPLKHPAHLVGQGVLVPVVDVFRLARQFLPSLQTVGVAWNPAETNSAIFTGKAREAVKTLGLTLLEANVDGTSGVADAVNSLISRGAQALWVGGDLTVSAAVDSVIAICQRARVPVFSILPGRADRGTLFDMGPDFVEAGRQAAVLVAAVLRGADMRKIRIQDIVDVVPPFLSVNTMVLHGLKDRWQIPDDVRRKANVLVDESGIHRKSRTRAEAETAH
jgi:putative tryptophan/tyrosine transport system substrate-binding protein